MKKIRNTIRKILLEISTEPSKPNFTNDDHITNYDKSRTIDHKKMEDIKEKMRLQYNSLKYIHENLTDANIGIGNMISALEKGENGIKEIDVIIEEMEHLKRNTILMLDGLDYIKKKL